MLISSLTAVRITEGLLSGDFETRQRIVSLVPTRLSSIVNEFD